MLPIFSQSIYQKNCASFVLLHYIYIPLEVVLVNDVGQLSHFTSKSIALFCYPPLSQDQELNQDTPYSNEIVND